MSTEHSLEQYKAQAVAEFAVLKAFDLPLPETSGDFERCQPSNFGIHAVLHGGSGIPQSYKAGDLLVLCKLLDGRSCRIDSIQIAQGDGSLRSFIGDPSEEDLPARIAEFLAVKTTKEKA